MNNLSEEYPARLKATLANFRSYCQKNSRSVIQLSATSHLNCTMTKYRSIRDMKMIPYRHDAYLKTSPKKQSEHCQSKVDPPQLYFKSSDVIEMIRTKLRQNAPKNQRFKTQQNLKEGTHSRYSKKGADMTAFLLRSTKFAKSQKRKKMDLTVTNTKCDIFPRQQRIEKSRQIVIALKQRPSSAIACRPKEGSLQSQQKTEHKFSLAQEGINLKKQQRRTTEPQCNRQLSGWEIPTFDEPLFEGQETGELKCTGKRKKKVKRRGGY